MKQRYEKAGALIATTAVAALGNISLARAASFGELSSTGRANTYLADQANKFPTPEQIRKQFTAYYKNTSNFLESIRESNKPQALYGALVIKADKGKRISAYDSPTQGTRKGIEGQIATDTLVPGKTHNVAVIMDPVYKEFNGIWYVYGYEYAEQEVASPPNFIVDTSYIDTEVKAGMNKKKVSEEQFQAFSAQTRRIKIFRLDDLKLGSVEYWGYGGTKPNFIQTFSMDGRNLNQEKVDAQHPQNGAVASYVTDTTPYGITKYRSYQTLLGEHGFQKMPVGFGPGLPY